MTPPARIRVLLAEDNLIARVGTRSLLAVAPEIEVVGEAEDGVQALQLWRSLRPDVLISDLRMPNLDGVQLVTAVHAEDPNACVLILSFYEGDEDVVRALRAGALGYVTKETDAEKLFEAIRTVAAHQRYVPTSIAARLTERMLKPALTLRELQVLSCVARGLSNREIASELKLTERTAGTYVSNAIAKLDAKSRSEAVAVAVARGILRRD